MSTDEDHITVPTVIVKEEKLHKQPLVLMLFGMVVVLTCAIVGLTVAVWSATTSRNDLQHELSCRGAFSAETQQRLSDAISAMSDAAATTLEGLNVGVAGADGNITQILADVPAIVDALHLASQMLATAADAQEQSLKACQKT